MIHPRNQQLGRECRSRQPLAKHATRIGLRIRKTRIGQRQQLLGLLRAGSFHGREPGIDALAAVRAHVHVCVSRQRCPLAQAEGMIVERLQRPSTIALRPRGTGLQRPPHTRCVARRRHIGQRPGEQRQRIVVHPRSRLGAKQRIMQPLGNAHVAARVLRQPRDDGGNGLAHFAVRRHRKIG
ncbi:hypothetical protein SDC9_178913 [bioreactor metagenome]|uniref:Uncharacterized protein n=1 Tax=bioreactor metagenome TaxID=1076179 RepID=A0A645H0D1_9ZZZZ